MIPYRVENDLSSTYLLYDADCGPCTSFMNVARRLDLKRSIIPVPLEDPLSEQLVGDRLSKDQMFNSFHLVKVSDSGTKQVFSAGDGLAHLLEYFPLGRFTQVLERLRSFRRLMNWTYRQATRFRKSSCEIC